MHWDKFSQFVELEGGQLKFLQQVPESCIQSAEFVLQCIANGKMHVWKEGEDVKPNAIATFGNGEINITTSEHVEIDAEGKTDFSFLKGALPAIGQGLAIVWAKEGNPPGYLMHFGTVIASGHDDKNAPIVCITNLMEQHGEIKMVDLTAKNTKIISSTDDFKFSTRPGYVIGALRPR